MQEMLVQQNNKGKKQKRVVITIKQQNADGQMQQINPALLAALKADSNSKTVFKA